MERFWEITAPSRALSSLCRIDPGGWFGAAINGPWYRGTKRDNPDGAPAYREGVSMTKPPCPRGPRGCWVIAGALFDNDARNFCSVSMIGRSTGQDLYDNRVSESISIAHAAMQSRIARLGNARAADARDTAATATGTAAPRRTAGYGAATAAGTPATSGPTGYGATTATGTPATSGAAGYGAATATGTAAAGRAAWNGTAARGLTRS